MASACRLPQPRPSAIPPVAAVTPLSRRNGIVAVDDVVLVKINYQWPERGGTSTDLLRGLIRAIVDHPDGFTGEVVICETTQFAGADGFESGDTAAWSASVP